MAWLAGTRSTPIAPSPMPSRQASPRARSIAADSWSSTRGDEARNTRASTLPLDSSCQLRKAANAEFQVADAEALPLPDASVDVVISNGVLNLCPDKPRVLAKVYRVLRPGVRLQLADILLH